VLHNDYGMLTTWILCFSLSHVDAIASISLTQTVDDSIGLKHRTETDMTSELAFDSDLKSRKQELFITITSH
jgi:hypothetical protein